MTQALGWARAARRLAGRRACVLGGPVSAHLIDLQRFMTDANANPVRAACSLSGAVTPICTSPTGSSLPSHVTSKHSRSHSIHGTPRALLTAVSSATRAHVAALQRYLPATHLMRSVSPHFSSATSGQLESRSSFGCAALGRHI